jgi:hypothetical protein
MTDAEYFHQHKDDSEEWGEPKPLTKRSEKRRLASLVSVRLSPDEVDIVRRVATERQMTLSGFMRNAALAAAEVHSAPLTTGALHGRIETRTENNADQPGVALWTFPASVTAAA